MTKQGGWTPGPWSAFPHYGGTGEYAMMRVVGPGQFETVADIRHGCDEVEGDDPVATLDANAALIAAAPDLAEALEEASVDLCNAICCHPTSGDEKDHTPGCIRARAALTKARSPIIVGDEG